MDNRGIIKRLTTYILLAVLSCFILVPSLPAYTKTQACCSCCVQAPCHCGCSAKTRPIQQTYASAEKNQSNKCSLNTCKQNLPFKIPATVIANAFTPLLKKKALLEHQPAIFKENKFLLIVYSPRLEPHKKLPIPDSLYLLTRCLLL